MVRILVLFIVNFISLYSFALDTIVLTPVNYINFDSDVSVESMQKIAQQLYKLDKDLPKNRDIFISINTYGGDLDAAYQLIQITKQLNHKVNTITIKSVSAGFHLVQGLGYRYIISNGTMMTHPTSISLNDIRYPGNLISIIKQTVKDLFNRDRLVSKRLGLSVKKYHEKIIGDWNMDAESAIQNNAADKIINIECSPTLKNQTHEKAVQVSPFFPVQKTLVYSDCPLITLPINEKENRNE